MIMEQEEQGRGVGCEDACVRVNPSRGTRFSRAFDAVSGDPRGAEICASRSVAMANGAQSCKREPVPEWCAVILTSTHR